ncbi:hypothetical protein IscW_ISCW000743, partial [Ixodes scapularis]
SSRGQPIICGDFNVDNESWGGTRTDSRERQLEDTAAALQLRALNDGSKKFCRRGTNANTIDLTWVSSEVVALWTTQPDTGESDH